MIGIDSMGDATAWRFVEVMMHSLWQGALFAALAAALSAGARTPRVRHGLNLGALLATAIAVPVTWCVLAAHGAASVPEAAVASPATSASDLAPHPLLQQGAPWMLWFYLVGATMMLSRLGRQWWHAGGRRLSGAGAAPDWIVQLVRREAKRLGLQRLPTVRLGHQAIGPAVVGVIRPVVLMPMAAISGLSPEQIRPLIVHELAHIRRWDPAVHMLQRLIEALLFHHPAVWWLSHRIDFEREQCCDDAAAASVDRPEIYVGALLTIAQQILDARNAGAHERSLVMSAAQEPSTLRRRIERLLGRPSVRPAPGRAWLSIALVALIMSVVALPWLQAAPPPQARAKDHARQRSADHDRRTLADYIEGLIERGRRRRRLPRRPRWQSGAR